MTDTTTSTTESPESRELLHQSVQDFLTRHGLLYKVFSCDPDFADTAAFCEKYSFSPSQSANAIIAASKSEPTKYACCVILATTKVDINKTLCRLMGVKKASFATPEQTLELTGMLIGGVTPFGLPDIPTYVDSAVMQNEEIVLGGGNRSTKVLMAPAELDKIPHLEVVEGLAIVR